MTKVKALKNEGLKHEFSVTVPKADVDAQKDVRLEEIKKTAKMQGFRPGKVPLNVIKQHYGAQARSEALEKTVSSAIDTVLSEHKLRPSAQPKIEWVSTAEDKDVEFKLTVEVLPDVKIGDFSKIAETIIKLTKRVRQPEALTSGRAAIMGDIVVIDYDGSVDGERHPGMKGANHALELGSKSFIDTFEEQLVGSNVGDKIKISVTFPKEYHAADLAGKKASFDVEVKELRQHKPVELNDALGKEMGFPGIDKLRERVSDDIGADYKRIGRAVIKRALMDKLAEAYSFEVPNGLLETEFGNIWKQVEEAKAKGELPEEDKKKSDAALRTEYRNIAERRIRLGLLLAEVATQNKIEVTSSELRNALMAEAKRFPGQEKAVFEYYTKTQGALERIRAPLLEEKVVDFIFGKAKITEKKMSAEELLNLPEEE